MKKLLLISVVILMGCGSIQSNESRILVDSKRLKNSDRCYRCVPKVTPLKTAPKQYEKDEDGDE